VLGALAAFTGLSRNCQTIALRARSGRTRTTFRAGFAFIVIGSFVNGLIPWRSFVAGFRHRDPHQSRYAKDARAILRQIRLDASPPSRGTPRDIPAMNADMLGNGAEDPRSCCVVGCGTDREAVMSVGATDLARNGSGSIASGVGGR